MNTFTKTIQGETHQCVVKRHAGVGSAPVPFKVAFFYVHREASVKNEAGFVSVAHTATRKLAMLQSAFATEIKNADVGL